jgi:hypothetical protein
MMAMYLSVVRADNVIVDTPIGSFVDFSAKLAGKQFKIP